MKLVVCPLQEVRRLVGRHRPGGVVTLLAPEQRTPRLGVAAPHLRLAFHDIEAPRTALHPPGRVAIGQLLDFAAALPPDATLLVHCWMGVSRSPAAAFILACAATPATPETSIARALRRAAPTATPNRLMVRLADDYLGREGRMVEAIARIGQGALCNVGVPFTLDLAGQAVRPDA